MCGRVTEHESQSWICTAPNVLVVQVRRGVGRRLRVAVEEVLDLPGLPSMALVGVVYHLGEDMDTGHYTCLCRGPQGGFWLYDDDKSVKRVFFMKLLMSSRRKFTWQYIVEGTAAGGGGRKRFQGRS